jgi:hypothetical protein
VSATIGIPGHFCGDHHRRWQAAAAAGGRCAQHVAKFSLAQQSAHPMCSPRHPSCTGVFFFCLGCPPMLRLHEVCSPSLIHVVPKTSENTFVLSRLAPPFSSADPRFILPMQHTTGTWRRGPYYWTWFFSHIFCKLCSSKPTMFVQYLFPFHLSHS